VYQSYATNHVQAEDSKTSKSPKKASVLFVKSVERKLSKMAEHIYKIRLRETIIAHATVAI